MSIPFLDYLPCDLVSYHETVEPALGKAWQGDFQPLRELMASAQHVSYWPIFNVPNPLPDTFFAGPKCCFGWDYFRKDESIWPQLFNPRDFPSALREELLQEAEETQELNFWALCSRHLPALFDDHVHTEPQTFLLRCLFYTFCSQLPSEEMADCREIGNEDLFLWEEYISRTSENGALWDGFEPIRLAIDSNTVGWLSPEKTAHLLATVPAGERPLLYAVVDGCVRDYHYTWTNWPLSPELAALAVRIPYLRPNNGYPQHDKEKLNNPDREVFSAYMREYVRKKQEMDEEFRRTAITDEEQQHDIFRRMYLYWLEHQPEGFLEQNEHYYQNLARMEITIMGRFKYATEHGWGMLMMYKS